jgi:hypothetical protein
MHRTLLLLTFFTAALAAVRAQSPAAGNAESDKPRRFELGLNITHTLVSFLGGDNQTLAADPYLLSLRIGRPEGHFRMGVNFRVHNSNDFDFFSDDFREKERFAHARVGYAFVEGLSRRFGLYWGVDAVGDVQWTRVTSFTQTGTAFLESQLIGFGGGPVLGVQWRVHPRVTLTTESALYGVYRSGFESIEAPPDFQREPVDEFVLEPTLPTALFIHFSF